MPTGQALGDLLSGAAGAPVNRPALNAFIATSQARNGLVSAQTQDALIKASQAQEKEEAKGKIHADLVANGAPESEAQLATDFLIQSQNGDPVTAMKALSMAKLGYGNAQSQTGGQQMFEGKLAAPIAVPPNFVSPPGSVLSSATIQQSPQGAAQTADTQSQTALRNAQTAAGGFNPHSGASAGQLDPNAVAFGSYMLYKTGKMPAMGMGGGAARMAIISGAAQLANQEAQGQPVTNPGFDTAIMNGQDFTGAQRALNTFAGGPLGAQTKSINNVVGHLQLMDGMFTALHNGDIQLANKLGNQWNKAFGSPAPTNVQTAAEFIGPELVKILSANNSTGTNEEREGFSNTAANLANAPEQTSQAIGTLKNMLGRQLTDLALQYHGATSRNDFARRYVAPDVAQYLEIGPEGAATPAAALSLGDTVPTMGGGGATPIPNTASYPDEQSALRAGHKIGDRVTINGVSGTLQ